MNPEGELNPPRQDPPCRERLSIGDAVHVLVSAGIQVAGVVHALVGEWVKVQHAGGDLIWYFRDQVRKLTRGE